ncbi:MAG: efflux RND transporter permease subunit, partial [Desulfobacterales bacterium]|nr:efflux RND transporter permease subunit [Desulfobacterales bacterium]
MNQDPRDLPRGLISGIVYRFLSSRLSIILIIVAFCLGTAAILVTPREEEPQIVVPMADIYVQAPGAAPAEIEDLIATPLERLLWQIDGVEYVYSMSRPDMAIVTVRFFVGEDRENSLVKLHNKISMNIDQAAPIVKGWVIKPVEIDDVPIVNLTLYSARHDAYQLRRIGEEVLARLSEVKDISRTDIVGGLNRQIRVELSPEKMAGLGIALPEVYQILKNADASAVAGTFSRFNTEFTVTSNSFLASADEVAALMVGVHEDRPVYLRDIASVSDGPRETDTLTRLSFSHFFRQETGQEKAPVSYPAVTLALAKKKGTNAVKVSRDILNRMDELRQRILPDGVQVAITRDYGRTAQEKVTDLLSSLVFAILTVVALLAVTLGWREALIVAFAVPVSFCLALFVNFLFGYTINRVTLFALILSLGLVVDDPITNVDNIQRHLLSGRSGSFKAILTAVEEVLPPVIMSTLAIIVCFVPLFFITGMMGPYMAPMAANVPLTVIFSTVCALTIVPWMSHGLLKHLQKAPDHRASEAIVTPPSGWIARVYHAMVSPFLESRLKRYLLLAGVIILLILSIALAVFRFVPLKMLPFDNKNEFQIVIDMPEGTTLEMTDRVVRSFERYLRTVPEITSLSSYVGQASPMDFNGLVRHYYLRKGSHLADIRINLAEKYRRKQQSHDITLRIRNDLNRIAASLNADIKLIEIPPGPPVLSTIVAEIYASPERRYEEMIESAFRIKALMKNEPSVVDIDVMAEAARDKINFILDKEKAALHGVDTRTVIQTLKMAIGGMSPATVHISGERQPLMVHVILPRISRSDMTSLSQIPIRTASGSLVPLAELTRIENIPEDQPIYHKNLERVVYVTAEMAGRSPAEAVIDMQKKIRLHPMPPGIRVQWAGEGEWKITLRVFRDMAIAFGAALIGIYILLIIQTNSFFMPLLIMMAIPLTLLGIMPGFYLLNLMVGRHIGGYYNPVFFTATSMIGMIALGGIVIRNSLILIEFIQDALGRSIPLKEAILQSGAIRMRPIVLTALTTALGAWPITLDPVFSGLAWEIGRA